MLWKLFALKELGMGGFVGGDDEDDDDHLGLMTRLYPSPRLRLRLRLHPNSNSEVL